MPDSQPQNAPATPSPDLGTIMGADKSAIDDLIGVQKQKTAADTAILDKADKRLDADSARIDKAFEAEGVSAAEKLKPWNADAEHKRFESNPIEGFGSLGGLFAMVASAFTKKPMQNAIEGMAGAINSIKSGNEAAYERAHESWKENTKLALDRWKTQHELYQDALSLMDHDAAASQAKLHNAAVKFGDQQTLILAEHGMIKEVYELQSARAKAAEQMQESLDGITKGTIQRAAVKAIVANPPNTGDPVQDKMMIAAQVQRVYDGNGKYGSGEQEAVGRYVQEHLKDPADKFAEGLADIHQQFSPKAQNIQGYQEARQAEMDANNGTISPEKDAELLRNFGLSARPTGSGTGTSSQANKTKAIDEIIAKHKAEGKEITRAEAEREYKQTIQIPTAHDMHSDDTQYAKAERMEHTMDQMDELLVKHKALTGIGGTLTRPVEAISNILGSNETDRKQFQRFATELKEWGQSVINDRTGRPLSSEAKDAAVIFAGLNPGDTSANTIRAIVELRPVIKTIKEQIKARGQGKGPVSGGAESAPAKAETPKTSDTPWLNDPVKE